MTTLQHALTPTSTPEYSDEALVPRWRTWAARAVLGSVARRVPVDLVLPDGSELYHRRDSQARPRINLVRPHSMYARLAEHPKLGIGEGYTAGDWDVAPGFDLADALRPFAERMTSAVPGWLSRMRGIVDRPLPEIERNTLDGSRRNISAHYDLSNDLFATFLDPSLMYSSALFDPATERTEQDFTQAQLRKVDRALDRAGVVDGSKVLEIGTGWGTLAIRAAQRGAQVTTLTLSVEQAALAKQRAVAAGVSDLIDIRVEDYREARGTFDAVISIEMIEAVGEEFWPTYFATIEDRLAPGGVALVQSILMEHDRLLATKNSYGWIQKHIFPGGLIPSERAIGEVIAAHTNLHLADVHRFGLDYGETLRRWRLEFSENWSAVQSLGFDEEFRRAWEFYLAYCQVGFETGYLDVAQIEFRRPR